MSESSADDVFTGWAVWDESTGGSVIASSCSEPECMNIGVHDWGSALLCDLHNELRQLQHSREELIAELRAWTLSPKPEWDRSLCNCGAEVDAIIDRYDDRR